MVGEVADGISVLSIERDFGGHVFKEVTLLLLVSFRTGFESRV